MKGFGLKVDMTMGDNGVKNALNVAFRGPMNARGQTADSEASEYTVQLGIIQSDQAVETNGPPNLRAKISWVTNGVTVDRLVTVGGGTSVSGSGEGCAVQLQDWSNNVQNPNFEDYEATIAMVPGTRASVGSPMVLVPLLTEAELINGATSTVGGVYTIPPAASVVVSIPQNVGVISLYCLGSVANPVVVTQYDALGDVLFSHVAEVSEGFLPLAPQAVTVVLNRIAQTTSGVSGTSTLTGGNATVTGTDTRYIGQIVPGTIVLGPVNIQLGTVYTVDSDTQFALTAPFSPSPLLRPPYVYTITALSAQGTGSNVALMWGIEG